MDEDATLHLIEQFREIDEEQLHFEEVETLTDDSDDSDDHADASSMHANGRNDPMSEFTFNPSLASLHTYLGEVEDTNRRMAFVGSGTILTVPLFFLEGVVLFPEATLPLRILEAKFITALEKAMSQVKSPNSIGVVRVYRDPGNRGLRFASVGTTAEVRQHRRLEDGSVNVVTRGKQRFRLRRHWIDVDGALFGEIEIIDEDVPLRTPRDAFGNLPPLSNLGSQTFSTCTRFITNCKLLPRHENNDSEAESEDNLVTELSLSEKRMHQCATETCCGYDTNDESMNNDDEKYICESNSHSGRSQSGDGLSQAKLHGKVHSNLAVGKKDKIGNLPQESDTRTYWSSLIKLNHFRVASSAFWPYWVYEKFDSFTLARKAADLWDSIVGVPSMEGFVKTPDVLSFYVGSKIPVSESIRQELLEIDGTSYRLRREIELLKGFDRVHCKNCQTLIARRSDMLVMSTEGPLGAYVNPGGYVHAIMTFYKANGLVLMGRPSKKYSWFPGYAWTIANCDTCERHMGWLFTSTNKKLKPRSFYGIRSSQVADDTR